jgi:CRISPR-associated endonuclease/helicase Cas3
MTALDFGRYFHAVHGVSPFPWQERLVEHLIEHDSWPDLVDLPTASGKTACLDIALFHLAWCSEKGEPWRAPRRILFVVDRRIIVDAAATRAERIRQALESTESEAVKAVASALKKAGGSSPLLCEKLRGGMPRERGIALNPAQPMIITSTVDQVGSRLLFRGYGMSPYTWPLHAGLLAFDTLLLLDEAHLSVPFVDTISALQREQAKAEKPITFVRPIRFVSLSATARTNGSAFRLDKKDLAHPLIRERRKVSKPTRLVETSSKPAERVRALLKETLATYSDLASTQQPAVAVIVNRVRTARTLFEALQAEQAKYDFSVELLTGRSRPLDRDEIASRLIARCAAGRGACEADHGLIVVATQTLEVGADLDFQGMVSECAALDALRQRFGRLDRLGKFGRARAVILGGGDSDDDAVYGPALNETWQWLNSIATTVDRTRCVDFSIEAMDALVASADTHKLITRSRSTLQLTPLHVELLSQTSPTPAYDPDVEALLHGLDSGPRDVQVVWRNDFRIHREDSAWLLDTSESALQLARELLRLNPPSSLEALSLPLHAVRSWLDGREDKFSMADVEGAFAEGSDRTSGELPRPRPVLRWREDSWEPALPRQIRPGDTIAVPSEYGGCDEYGFAPDYNDRVRDLSGRAREALHRSPLLIITKKTGEQDAADPAAVNALWQNMVRDYAASALDVGSYLPSLRQALGQEFLVARGWPLQEAEPDLITDLVTDHSGDLHAVVVTNRRPAAGDISDEDISSSQTVPVTLGSHNSGVGRKARELGSSVGLAPELVQLLGRAGELHDIGKADPRFQSMLRGDDVTTLAGELLAKGLRRVKQSTLELGERHEAYSAALLRMHPNLVASESDPALAVYLVGTHHGRGRPLMPDRRDDGTELRIEVDGQRINFDGAPRLGELGSGWATLFWALSRRYGAWGLAYLEAILRLADWLRSAEELNTEVSK